MNYRRAAACFGVLLAGAATLATSPKRWEMTDFEKDTFVLDDATPKKSVHVTVVSSHRTHIRLTAIVTWGAEKRAELLFSGKSDDGRDVFDSKAAPFVGEAGALLPQTAIAHSFDCPGACTRGYTLSFERTAGAPERVSVAWQVEAQTRELGDRPPGANVVVRVDPPPAP